MELWTEYEGKTIDGAFSLKKLVSPQGRSALFSTANAKGEQTLIRLVACHFDEDEILARWHGVEALNHPNFLRLERYGQLELDQTKVVYAAFERTDANLAQVLAQGCLSLIDTRQLAANLASALAMLHANGFVHEHISAESVFAIGEVVKLRTDCIRETPEGTDGQQARKRDVRDLAILVLQALTQERTLEAAQARRRRIPAPFDQIVPNTITGQWDLAEIAAALQSPQQPRTKSASSTPPSPAPSASRPANPTKPARSNSAKDDLTPAALRSQTLPGAWREESNAEKRKWIGAAAIAAVVLLLLWAGVHFYSHRAAHAEASAAANTPASHVAHLAPRAATRSPHSSAPQPAAQRHEVWRVVAYTYDRREQAEKKSADLAQHLPGIQAAVFSPNGRAPYLVTVGGDMNRNQAYTLAHRARKMGLPRDTYAQNYKVAR